MGDKSNFNLVDWVKKCSSLKEGGLRIRKLSTFNKALLDHGGDQWWACGRVLEQGRTPSQSSEFSWGDGSHVHFGMTYGVESLLLKRTLSRFVCWDWQWIRSFNGFLLVNEDDRSIQCWNPQLEISCSRTRNWSLWTFNLLYSIFCLVKNRNS